MSFLDRFQRVVPNGKFYPELDGLRFLAIFSVLIFHALHASKLVAVPTTFIQEILFRVFRNGFQGVELFFVISGYIIGLPFAKQYLIGAKKIKIKDYLLRRVTRLEPPYLIAILGFMLAKLVIGDINLEDGLISFISSVFYVNTIIFNDRDFLIVLVIWSLEIEIQFYLLAVFFSKLFKLPTVTRRLAFLLVIIGFPILHQVLRLPVTTIYDSMQYFFIGFLLVDLHLTHKKVELSRQKEILIGFISLMLVLYINHENNLLSELFFMSGIFGLYYLTLFGNTWKKIFSIKVLSVIGGMCYSIYLIHYPFFLVFSRFSDKFMITDSITINLVLKSSIVISLALVISAVYYLLIEKPCMDKNWPSKLRIKLKKFKDRFSNLSIGRIQ